MAVLTGITNKRFDAASLAALLEKLKGTYGSIQDIIDAIDDATFEIPEGTEVDTTHTIKFIGEDGLNTILQLIKNVKDSAGTGNISEEQLNALETSVNAQLESFGTSLSTLGDVVEAMNEDVNDLSETSEAHTTSISGLEEQVENNTTGLAGIVDTANATSFTEPAETAVDTTHTIKFIGEAGIEAILQLIKSIKENCESQFVAMGTQLDAINGGISSLSDVVEAMNEDVNDLVETSASHTASINEITTWINEFNDKITE